MRKHFGGVSIDIPVFGTFEADFGRYSKVFEGSDSRFIVNALTKFAEDPGGPTKMASAGEYAKKLADYQKKFYGKVQGIGGYGSEGSKLDVNPLSMVPKLEGGLKVTMDDEMKVLIKKDGNKYKTRLTDKVNLVPYGGHINDNYPKDAKKDFVRLAFRDVVNSKWIIFSVKEVFLVIG